MTNEAPGPWPAGTPQWLLAAIGAAAVFAGGYGVGGERKSPDALAESISLLRIDVQRVETRIDAIQQRTADRYTRTDASGAHDRIDQRIDALDDRIRSLEARP